MTPVVVSYYPGSGGIRLARMLANYDWQISPGASLHSGGARPTPSINFADRDIRPYPTKSTRIIRRTNFVEITHCVNSDMLSHHFPGRRVIKIKSDLTHSLSRYWAVAGQQQFEPEIRKISQHYAMNKVLAWHHDYYTATGVDWQADKLYNLESDSDEFCEFMRQEMQNSRSTEFDQYVFVWQKFKRQSLNF
jgi:hypothetical protein